MTESTIIILLGLINKELEKEYEEGYCRYDVHYITDLIIAKRELLIEKNGETDVNDEIIKKDYKKYIEQL